MSQSFQMSIITSTDPELSAESLGSLGPGEVVPVRDILSIKEITLRSTTLAEMPSDSGEKCDL
jgi:hypothetical protein